jgi:hypothetical protein
MFETYDATKRCEKPGTPARLTAESQRTWDANERIVALTAERDSLLADVAPLRDVILALGEEAWLGNTYRQQEYEVHQQTQSIVMVFTDGSGWPDIEVRREPGWDLLAATAVPLLHRIIADHYPPGGSIIRAMAARLGAGGDRRGRDRRASGGRFGAPRVPGVQLRIAAPHAAGGGRER